MHQVNDDADRRNASSFAEKSHLFHARLHRSQQPYDAGYSARPMMRSITAIIQN